MQVKSFTYERSWYGIYHRKKIFSMEKMDSQVGKMFSRGWRSSRKWPILGEGSVFVLW